MSTGRHRQHRDSKVRVKASGVLLAGMLSGAVATGAFNGAPPANATCFSAFGLGNGNGCTSNLTTIAIGIGSGATAEASLALFGAAVAIGTDASAANAISAFTSAMAFGDNATASALFSIFGALAQIGPGITAVIGGPNIAIGASAGLPQSTTVIGGFNFAAQLGPGSTSVIGGLNFAMGVSPFGNGAQDTVAGLFATFALNLFSNSSAYAQGVLAAALNVLGLQLWPLDPLIKFTAEALTVAGQNITAFLASILAPLAPPPAALAVEADESEQQQLAQVSGLEPATAPADVEPGAEEAGAAAELAVAPVSPDELQPAEAPAEAEVIDESIIDPANHETESTEYVETGTVSIPDDHTDVDQRNDGVVAVKNDDDALTGTSTGTAGTNENATSSGATETGDDESDVSGDSAKAAE
jgi:hypothetical protein